MSDLQRLFFALWPSAEQQQAWAESASHWLAGESGRFVKAENLHITLLFIGETSHERRHCLEAMADSVVAQSFGLSFDHVCYWRRPQVIYLGVKEQPRALEGLVSSLRRGAEACDLKTERRPFKAHLTLARKAKHPSSEINLQAIDWQVNSFVLVRSKLSQMGARYEVLRRWQLQ